MDLVLGALAILSTVSIVLAINANNKVERLDSQLGNVSEFTNNRINRFVGELSQELFDLKKALKAPKEAKVAVKKKRVKK